MEKVKLHDSNVHAAVRYPRVDFSMSSGEKINGSHKSLTSC